MAPPRRWRLRAGAEPRSETCSSRRRPSSRLIHLRLSALGCAGDVLRLQLLDHHIRATHAGVEHLFALIRRDVHGDGVDVHRVAAQYGYRIVWAVRLDTGPLASALILAGAVMEHEATAVVVPSLPAIDHSDRIMAVRGHSAVMGSARDVIALRPPLSP